MIEDFTSTYYNSFDRLQNVANCFCISMALWYILCTKFSSLCKFLRQFAAKKFTPQELAEGEVKMIKKQIKKEFGNPANQKYHDYENQFSDDTYSQIFVHIRSSSSCMIALSETLRYGILRNLQKTEE